MKLIEKNKKAFFDYEFEEKTEAGIVLAGSEVKSVKMGNISLRDAGSQEQNGEMCRKNCYIAPHEKGSAFNEDPRRNRKLLLH
ncbi:MAG: SsrA-binding protein, partial [Firmicutes bacterium]|nr:SsrA-binding protein [Bacillota bacterium]